MTVLFFPMLIMPRSFCVYIFQLWTKFVMFMLKKIVGLEYEEKNKHYLDEALKNGSVILACKHQSAWETIFCSLITNNFVIVLKKALLLIPIYGIYLKKLNSISIDRSQGFKSLKRLLAQCRYAISNNLSILIFPEGHRIPYGEKGNYQPGIIAIYRDLNVAVVPIGVNSGKFWPRKAKFKKQGLITISYGEAIPPNLSKEEFKKRLEESIESLSIKD